MNELITAVQLAALMVATVCVYFFLVKMVFPRFLIKRRYFTEGNFGRGLRKFRSEDGRALLYEPHPSVRKYIKQYALVNDGGTKYLECYVDRGVNRMIYNVVMMDRNDKVIDCIEVEEVTAKRELTQPVYLHPDTSYIALIISSVNKEKLPGGDVSYYQLKDIMKLGAAVAALTLVASLALISMFSGFVTSLGASYVDAPLFLPSLIAALVGGGSSVGILLYYCGKKNIRVKK